MPSLFPPPGPPLRPFQSLLIKGKYHASAPIHLCLSHALEPETIKALLVVPSRSSLKKSLKQLKDEWIKMHGGEGRTSGAAMKVQVLSVRCVSVKQLGLNYLTDTLLPPHTSRSYYPYCMRH